MNAPKPDTILLVDDDADFVDMNRVVLEKHGFRVLAAYNGTECIAKAQAEHPDLIVLDVMMASPTEGFHVTYDLRKHEATRNIPVLMVTSVNEAVPYKFEAHETWLPVNAFIEKPISPERLLAEVRRQLQRPSPPAAES